MRIECFRIVKGLNGKNAGPAVHVEEVANGEIEKYCDHQAHGEHEQLVGLRRGFDAAHVQSRDDEDDDEGDHKIWDLLQVTALQCRRNPYDAEQRLQNVVENHRPADEKAKVRIDDPAHVGISRSRRWVDGGHSAVADGGHHHGQHGYQNDGHRVAIGEFLRDAEKWNRGGRLDKHHSVKDEVPQREDLLQAQGARGKRWRILGHPCLHFLALAVMRRRELPSQISRKDADRCLRFYSD